MSLQSRVLHIPASAGGIDERLRPELVQPNAAALTYENVRPRDRGGIGKRYGFGMQTLSRMDATSRAAAYKLFSYGTQSCVIDGHTLDVYSPALGANVNIDRVPEAMPLRVTLPFPGASPLFSDATYVNGFYVAASFVIASGSLQLAASVLDATTHAILRVDSLETSLSLTNGLGIIAVGTTAILVYSGAANTIHARTLDLSSSAGINAGWSAKTVLPNATDWGGLAFDVHGMTGIFALAYSNNGGGTNRLTVRTYNAALVQQNSTTVNTSSTNISACCVAGSTTDTVWIGWSETTTAKVLGLTSALATQYTVASIITTGISATIAMMGIVVTGTGTGRLVASCAVTGKVSLNTRAFANAAGAVTTVGSTDTWQRLGLLTRPFTVDGRYYCSVLPCDNASLSNPQQCHFVVDIGTSSSTLRVVATIAARQSIWTLPGLVAHYASISSTKIGIVNATQRSAVSFTTGGALEITEVDFASPLRWQAVEYAGNVALTGGVTSAFDGQVVDEVGFLLRPDKPTTALSGGGITATGLQYIAIYEKNDASGNIIRGAPSDPSVAVNPSAQNVTLTLTTLQVTTRQDNIATVNKVRIAIYRSDDGVTPYKRVGTVANDPTVSTVTYLDSFSTVASNETLYCIGPGGPAFSPGAEQVHSSPPASRQMALYNDMPLVVADDGVTIFYPAQRIIGEGWWYSDIFQFTISEGGEITGLAAQDGTLFIFKRRAVFAISGISPSGNGSQGGFGDPRRISADVGCIEPRSIVVTALGVFFQSERGIELLTRGQAVDWVGEFVRRTVASFPVCTSAVLDATANVVYFEMASAETSNQVSGTGRTLVFDLTSQAQSKWISKDRRRNNAGTADTPAQSAAMIWTGTAWRYAWIGTDGRVYVEDRTTYLDPNSTWVTLLWEVPSINMGLQQEQRLYQGTLLYEPQTASGLLVEVGYNYAAYSSGDNKSITEAQTLGRRRVEIRPRPLATARFRISDTAPAVAATGQGLDIVGISFDIAPKQGSTRGTPRLDPTARA